MELLSGWAFPASPPPCSAPSCLCPILPVLGSACVTPVFREKLKCTSSFTPAVHASLGPPYSGHPDDLHGTCWNLKRTYVASL